MQALIYILVFPGFLFLFSYSMVLEYFDRKIYAKFQNRIGPPFFQPFADLLKLFGKEVIIPGEADRSLFIMLPLFALASVCTGFLYIPLWSDKAVFHFSGDLVVVLYLLMIPTICFSLAGWHSTSLYAAIGSIRTITQLFAYEVPLFMALLSPAIMAGSWSISVISSYFINNPLMLLLNIPAFIVAIISIQGKLERTPFDIPEAETEIVAGPFTEYSGKFFAFFRMTINIEMVVVSGLIAALFLPFYIPDNSIINFLLFLLKTLFIVFILTVIKSTVARVRIDQMIKFCWIILAPIALIQILVILILKGANLI